MSNPYQGLKDYQFWRRSVSNVEPHRFDPVTQPKFRIRPDAKVATAGSCFAQHISRKLKQIGFHYFVTEDGAGLPQDERVRRNFAVFSARFGNVYTTTQLLQLFNEAFGRRAPGESAWRRSDGRYVDPFRPQVEPDGFASPEEVTAARAEHLVAVRRMFSECDVFVFTLGLTEAWRSKQDGSVFPLAPGVAGGTFCPSLHEPVNFGVAEAERDLRTLLAQLREANPAIQVVLTVSPVPLIATWEDRSVVCSTTYSKSVLRVVADMVARSSDWIDYFPSFEIITSSNAGGRYFGPDYREVNELGVAHAMRSFVANYALGRTVPVEGTSRDAAVDGPVSNGGIVCDEETISMIRGPRASAAAPVSRVRTAFDMVRFRLIARR